MSDPRFRPGAETDRIKASRASTSPSAPPRLEIRDSKNGRCVCSMSRLGKTAAHVESHVSPFDFSSVPWTRRGRPPTVLSSGTRRGRPPTVPVLVADRRGRPSTQAETSEYASLQSFLPCRPPDGEDVRKHVIPPPSSSLSSDRQEVGDVAPVGAPAAGAAGFAFGLVSDERPRDLWRRPPFDEAGAAGTSSCLYLHESPYLHEPVDFHE